MKKTVSFALLSLLCIVATAQKPETLTTAIRQCKSMEQVLALPAVYTVIDCSITITTATRGALNFWYSNPNAKPAPGFNEQWTYWLSQAKTGDKILLSEIVVQRDGQRRKLAEKCFIVP